MEEQERRWFEEEELSRRSKPPSLVGREERQRCSKRLSPLDEVERILVVEDEQAFEAELSRNPIEPFRALVVLVEKRRELAVEPVEEELRRRLPVDGCCSPLAQLDLRLVRWFEQHLEGTKILESVCGKERDREREEERTTNPEHPGACLCRLLRDLLQ